MHDASAKTPTAVKRAYATVAAVRKRAHTMPPSLVRSRHPCNPS